MHCQDQDLRTRVVLEHLARSLESIQRRHADVKYRDIWPQFLRFFYGLAAVAGLPGNLPTGLGFQKRAQTLAHDFVVISD